MAKRVIYIHGFNSSEQSYKAVRFGEHMAQFDVDYQVPRLTHEPLHAILQLEQLLNDDTVLLGSSLGGFMRRICRNVIRYLRWSLTLRFAHLSYSITI